LTPRETVQPTDLERAIRLAEQIRSARLRALHLARVLRLLDETPDAPAELRERIERLKGNQP
jgi:hypothetical protein